MRMQPAAIKLLLLALLAAPVLIWGVAASSQAQQQYCPQGYRFTGEFRDEVVGNEIISHPQCVASNAWRRGQWRALGSVIIQNSACYTTYTCERVGQSVYAPNSTFHQTPPVRHAGWCQVFASNPRSCAICAGEAERPPSTPCITCVESPECSNPNLGWRTREAMGCCT